MMLRGFWLTGPMYLNAVYVGLKVVPILGTLGAKVSTIWVDGPLGLGFRALPIGSKVVPFLWFMFKIR